MSEREALEKAVADGVVSDDQAKALQDYLAKGGDPGASQDAENLRFLANLNDIFLSVGILILALGVTVGVAVIIGPAVSTSLAGAVAVCLIVAAGAWGMAEYFTARRKMLLPSMTLALIIYAAVMALTAIIALDAGADKVRENVAAEIIGTPDDDPAALGLFSALFSANIWSLFAGAAAMGAFYARFRLPFAVFLIAVSGALAFYSIAARLDWADAIGGGVALIAGFATLGAAIWFDVKDPERRTRMSDNAFWLHLAAAPQLMLGTRFFVGGDLFDFTTGQALVMLGVLILIGLASLALNRRALIVSGLITFATVIVTLFESVGVDGVGAVAGPLLVIGGSVVLLGGGWRTARRLVLRAIPETPLTQRIFPPETA